MATVLQRLESTYHCRFSDFKPEKAWTFKAYLATQDADFLRPLVYHYEVIRIEYSVLCAQIIAENKASIECQEKTKKQLTEALMLCELLEEVNKSVLGSLREVKSLRAEQAVFRQLLKKEYDFSPLDAVEVPEMFLGTSEVREDTAYLNWPRLFALRMRRLLNAISLTLNTNSLYVQYLTALNATLRPLIDYLSWIFFLPRLIANLALTTKHTIPWKEMQDRTKQLGWFTRLKVQLDKRWFELGNDSVWFVGGLVTCFVLTGALASISIYLAVALQAYDVVLAAIRYGIEVKRLQEVKDYYLSLEKKDDPEVAAYLTHLDHRIDYEKKRLILSIANTVVLLVAMSLAIPYFTSMPVIPIIAASIAVLTTLVFYGSIRKINAASDPEKVEKKTRPDNDVIRWYKHLRFFPENNKAPASSDINTSLLPVPVS